MGPALPGEMERIRGIWSDCFGDPPAYTDYIFSHLIRPEHVLVCRDASAPASILCIQPALLKSGGKQWPVAYIYGVATDPAARGRGLSTQLLSFAHGYLREQGFRASTLVPAEESLFAFYAQRGYGAFADVVRLSVAAEDAGFSDETCVLSACSVDELYRVREQFFGDRGPFVSWDRQYLSYIHRECAAFGGEVLTIRHGSVTGCAVCYKAGDSVLVKEMTLPDSLAEKAARAILSHFRAKTCLLTLHPESGGVTGGTRLQFALIKWYDNENETEDGAFLDRPSWIAHVLD